MTDQPYHVPIRILGPNDPAEKMLAPELDITPGDWIETYTGKKFRPLKAAPGDICIEDIAHALSLQCRFAGHCRRHYSVAEHSLGAYWMARSDGLSPRLQLRALLHDAAEAYLVDVPTPIKRHMGAYNFYEARLGGLIIEKFGATEDSPKIKEIDQRMLRSEAAVLLASRGEEWTWLPEASETETRRIVAFGDVAPIVIERIFLDLFSRVTEDIAREQSNAKKEN